MPKDVCYLLPEKKLLQALESRDEPLAEKILKIHKLDINCYDGDGSTPLLLAVDKDMPPMVDTLLEIPDIRVDESNHYGFSPLALAVQNENTSLVRKLLKYGADPNFACPTDGSTPFMDACEIGHLSIFLSCLYYGAS